MTYEGRRVNHYRSIWPWPNIAIQISHYQLACVDDVATSLTVSVVRWYNRQLQYTAHQHITDPFPSIRFNAFRCDTFHFICEEFMCFLFVFSFVVKINIEQRRNSLYVFFFIDDKIHSIRFVHCSRDFLSISHTKFNVFLSIGFDTRRHLLSAFDAFSNIC